jgi:peptide/nickel transport system substrate-binding protein
LDKIAQIAPKNMLNKILKTIGLLVGIVVFLLLGMYLFFEKQFDEVVDVFTPVDERSEIEEITLLEPYPSLGYDPLQFNPFSRQRLNQVYESLIRPDMDLNMESALALSWGLINDTTWEFNIRKNVKFHDGSEMDELDVIDSIDKARFDEKSELSEFLSTIKEIRRVEPYKIEIETIKPDPLLLQRLSTVYVYKMNDETAGYVGTGPFVWGKDSSDKNISLSRFDDYWGGGSSFKIANIRVETDKYKRFDVLNNGGADVLSYVPYDLADQIDLAEFDLVSVPSLEVQFLIFNFESEVFDDVEARRALKSVLDTDEFTGYIGEYAHPVKQFVSSGVFGYNPDIEDPVYDSSLVGEVEELNGYEVNVILPEGLDVLGEFLTDSFDEVGLGVYIQYVKSEYLVETLTKADFDIAFLGFKSELGDSSDFLKSLAHTSGEEYGQFNFANYSNEQVDSLIGEAELEMNVGNRLDLLQEAMSVLVEDDVYGIPLFEYDTLFASAKWVDFEPRIDGFIYINEL